jgi:hypothetical protein
MPPSSGTPHLKQDTADKKSAENARLSKALRANLQRRKAAQAPTSQE